MMAPQPPPRDWSELDQEILRAHAAGDGQRLARLYGEAARGFAATGDFDRAAYFHVQAYVFALDTGLIEVSAGSLDFLKAHGRE